MTGIVVKSTLLSSMSSLTVICSQSVSLTYLLSAQLQTCVNSNKTYS